MPASVLLEPARELEGDVLVDRQQAIVNHCLQHARELRRILAGAQLRFHERGAVVHADTLEAGLLTYRDRRVLRTTRLQLMSRAMGDHVYHPSGPHAALRNAIMTAKSQEQWLDALEWLYGGNGLE